MKQSDRIYELEKTVEELNRQVDKLTELVQDLRRTLASEGIGQENLDAIEEEIEYEKQVAWERRMGEDL